MEPCLCPSLIKVMYGVARPGDQENTCQLASNKGTRVLMRLRNNANVFLNFTDTINK